jgi:hypothetical protein
MNPLSISIQRLIWIVSKFEVYIYFLIFYIQFGWTNDSSFHVLQKFILVLVVCPFFRPWWFLS